MRIRRRSGSPWSPLFFALTWLSQLILWVTFADSAGVRELLLGGSAAAIGTYLAALYATRARQSFRIRPRYLVQTLHIPKILFSDTWTLLVAVKRQLMGQKLSGGIVSVRFRFGGDNSVSRARRALAITFLTLTPNTLVLGITDDPQQLFFHTVIPRPLPKFMTALGARPGHQS